MNTNTVIDSVLHGVSKKHSKQISIDDTKAYVYTLNPLFYIIRNIFSYLYMCVCIYMYIYTHTHTYTYIHIYIYLNANIF